jgi:ketosteroid isomerase-like protein
MKKAIKLTLLLAVIFAAMPGNSLNAQDTKTELLKFTSQFQDAYNAKNEQALKAMYSTDAVRVDAQGATTMGNDSISATFADFFNNNKVMIAIHQLTVTANADGSTTATGTYHVTGKAKDGKPIDFKGTYNNTLMKEGGNWRITRSVLTAVK